MDKSCAEPEKDRFLSSSSEILKVRAECRPVDNAFLNLHFADPFLTSMSPYEIFSAMSRDQAAGIFGYLLEKEKPLYKSAIENLAKQRRLRPVFVERKPRNERFAWMQNSLGRKANEDIAAHLLQIWLVGAHSKLLCDFLDALGIQHDENGTVDVLPQAPPKEELKKAVDAVLANHEPSTVAVYLHAFQAMDEEGGWRSLEELLAEDERLKLIHSPGLP